jgi:hypothetical protein
LGRRKFPARRLDASGSRINAVRVPATSARLLRPLLLVVVAACGRTPAAGRDATLQEVMPRAGDHGLVTWRDGAPYATGTPYSSDRRVLRVETGHWAADFDTERIAITGFRTGMGEHDQTQALHSALAAEPLPPAELQLVVRVNGTAYTCRGRATLALDRSRLPARPLEFPVRFVETGRYFQKFSLHDLEFQAEGGGKLAAQSRLDVAAWPDRLALVLIVTPAERWPAASVFLRLRSAGGRDASAIEAAADWPAGTEHRAVLVLGADGAARELLAPPSVFVRVSPISPQDRARVAWSVEEQCHRVRLEPAPWPVPTEGIYPEEKLDAREAFDVVVENTADAEQRVALNFDHGLTAPITGLVPLWLDPADRPTGLPVQLGKNWHLPRGGVDLPDAGRWAHGRTLFFLPPRARIALRYATAYARWGGLPTASLAQLSLIGWGHNGFWEQFALGSFGESFCFQPERVMRRSLLTDLRPLHQLGFARDQRWGWTSNLGGGDLVVRHDAAGRYVPFRRGVTRHAGSGPNLAQLDYEEVSADDALRNRVEVRLPQTGDLVRVELRLRLEVRRRVTISRLALFQLGSDSYNDSDAPLIAWGTMAGLEAEHRPGPAPAPLPRWRASGDTPWLSLHGQPPQKRAPAGQGSRGLVVRSWRATLGGRPVAAPWFTAARGYAARAPLGAEVIVPPEVTTLEPGDRVEAELAMLALPISAEGYYGPDEGLRAALTQGANTWKPVWRDAAGHRPVLALAGGRRVHGTPLAVSAESGERIAFTLHGGLGRVPVRLTGLERPDAAELWRVSRKGDERVGMDTAGRPAWQADYDAATARWNLIFTLPPAPEPAAYEFRLERPAVPTPALRR